MLFIPGFCVVLLSLAAEWLWLSMFSAPSSDPCVNFCNRFPCSPICCSFQSWKWHIPWSHRVLIGLECNFWELTDFNYLIHLWGFSTLHLGSWGAEGADAAEECDVSKLFPKTVGSSVSDWFRWIMECFRMSLWVKWGERICNKICIIGLNTHIAGIVFQEADENKGDFAIVVIYVNYNMLLIMFFPGHWKTEETLV